jgi:hypothetical protein
MRHKIDIPLKGLSMPEHPEGMYTVNSAQVKSSWTSDFYSTLTIFDLRDDVSMEML